MSISPDHQLVVSTAQSASRFAECEDRGSDGRVYLRPSVLGEGVRSDWQTAPASTEHRKRYGQFFTPFSVAALACAGAITPATRRIVDPMCGDGTVLRAAAERAAFLDKGRKTSAPNSEQSLLGVEVDDNLAQRAVYEQAGCKALWSRDGRILRAEAFTALSGLLDEAPPEEFDAVVGNPPYVRYQEMAFLLEEVCPGLAEAFQRQMGSAHRSNIAQNIIRTSLLHAERPLQASNLDELAREALQILKKPDALAQDLDPLSACWVRLVAGYSGLSDLSVPSWLLAWAVAKPDARIAFVSTTAWQNREYGRPLRYFMLRMLQPLAIVEQESKTWFQEADVEASLLLFRVRDRTEAAKPLFERQSEHQVLRLRVRQPHDLAAPDTLHQLAAELAGHDTVSACEASQEIMRALDLGGTLKKIEPNTTSLYQLEYLPEQDMIEQLLSGEGADGLLWALEGRTPDAVRIVRGDGSPQRIPGELCRALSLPTAMHSRVRNLCDYGVTANQGLRTGCNAFFYLRDLSPGAWDELLPQFTRSAVQKILSAPAAHAQEAATIAQSVKEAGGLAPTEPVQRWQPARLVVMDKELGGYPCLFPASRLIPAVRYQRELDELLIRPERLVNGVFVTRYAAKPEDFEKLRTRYDDTLLTAWRELYQLETLASVPAAFVAIGEQLTLRRGGKDVQIPQMSAVAPNVRTPSRERDLFDDVPPPPAWWYTLPIRARHRNSIFMPRVNSGPAYTYVRPAECDMLIDANFSTFSTPEENSIAGRDTLPPMALLALLNSSWTQLNLEYIATRMGGGALKVEAAHLQRLAVPTLAAQHVEQLDVLGKQLAEVRSRYQETLRQIDALLVAALMGEPPDLNDSGQTEVYQLAKRIREAVGKRVATRKR